jgi:hypothetical protein
VVVATHGAGAEADTELLHVLDIERRARKESFFSLQIPAAAKFATATVEHPAPVFNTNFIYRAVPPFDSIWSVAVTSPHHAVAFVVPSSRLSSNTEPVGLNSGARAAMGWVSSASFVGQFGRLSDGGWIVQVWGLRNGKPNRNLLRLDGNGRRLWEVENTPLLLTVESDMLYLWDPDGLEPNHIRVAHLK